MVYGDCQREDLSFVCADGTCHFFSLGCPLYGDGDTSNCDQQQLTFGSRVCPDGYCVSDESDCMRPCGFTMKYQNPPIVYNEPCPEWGNKCLKNGTGLSCPMKPQGPCPGQVWCEWESRCVSRRDQCTPCTSCNDGNGCFRSQDRCDGYNDCLDGTDELDCTLADTVYTSPISPTFMVMGLVGSLVLLVVICCICFKWCRRGRSQGTRTAGAAVVVSGTQPTGIPMTDLHNPYNQPAPGYNAHFNQSYSTGPVIAPPSYVPTPSHVSTPSGETPGSPYDDQPPSYQEVTSHGFAYSTNDNFSSSGFG